VSFVEIDGLQLYYELHGSGQPLVLLHGGFGSVEMFGPVLPLLAEGRQVVAVDLQAHGRTADVDRPLRFELMADDIAALADQLGMSTVDIMGYSVGGGVALRTGIQYPQLVRRLVLVSVPCRRTGWYPEVQAELARIGPELAELTRLSPIYQQYAKVAPRVQDWPVLWTKMGELLRQDYDWTDEVAGLRARTMLVQADADAVQPTHLVELYALLGGGLRDAGWDGAHRPDAWLAVLPGLTHYDLVAAPALAAAVVPFLDQADAKP
jgi:pimeloyl-ACP methyl ester carboxylesterase